MDETLAQNFTISYKPFAYLETSESGGNISSPFGMILDTGYSWRNFADQTLLGSACICQSNYKNATWPSSITTIQSPTADNYVHITKSYYAPGVLGTGDKTITYLSYTKSSGSSYGALFGFLLTTPITLKDTESFEIQMKFTYGRYTPP